MSASAASAPDSPAEAEDVASTTSSSTTPVLQTDLLVPLLAALDKLNATMEGVKSTLLDHGKKFDVLTKDALKNDQPYDEKGLDDEATCTAIYEIAVAKTREKAEQWNGIIDVTLIFIALFSAVLTAFLIPASQALSQTPNTSSNSTSSSSDPLPLPASSDEIVCALYYLSLITAIVVAVLCVLGRQWVRKLTTLPDVKSWKARTIWHVERMRRAELWIKILMETIYWSLLLSIGLFIAGLFYQLWNLATSFNGTARILLATWGLGIVLASAIIFTMIATTYHAVRYEGSVFEGILSKTIVAVAAHCAPKELDETEEHSNELWFKRGWQWLAQLQPIDPVRRAWMRLGEFESKKLQASLADYSKKGWASFQAWFGALSVSQLWRNTREWIGNPQVKVESESLEKLSATYLGLIAEASEPSLLERAVASLSYSTWVQYGHSNGSFNLVERAYDRLMATDTSIRVRETVNIQAARFAPWVRERRQQLRKDKKTRKDLKADVLFRQKYRADTAASSEAALKGIEEEAKEDAEEERRMVEVTKFLLDQRSHPIYRVFTPTETSCADILDLLALPFDECIANCLSVMESARRFENRERIFNNAVNYCNSLLESDQHSEATAILAHVDRLSIIRSLMQSSIYYPAYHTFLEFVAEDRPELLNDVNKTVKARPDWSTAHPDGVFDVFIVLAGATSDLPYEIDRSPLIEHFYRYPSSTYWGRATDAMIAYLTQYDIATMSNHAAISIFLQCCTDPDFRDLDGWKCVTSDETRKAAQALLTEHEDLFGDASPPRSPRSLVVEPANSSRQSLSVSTTFSTRPRSLQDSDASSARSQPESQPEYEDSREVEVQPNVDPDAEAQAEVDPNPEVHAQSDAEPPGRSASIDARPLSRSSTHIEMEVAASVT
ncbi:hypothetical protein SISSUDRAFT_1127995 [Sistotremastrum suecicum HHB10207 ss-3]|uniref:DUF6535 domain-containing protein n=1 Tax=Sistotremastrum suecicum HHB10207 ss-3 TaxID=1314776 RepID=A0A166EE26_9AGAM|nr:hypothetical protein SISSUDRAFT_1127995 [Sistotremastrum suecicum HHB10207 ss-3]